MNTLNTALLIACRLNKLDDIQLLVSQGADVNVAVYSSMRSNDVDHLLKMGVFRKMNSGTPLTITALHGHVKASKWLLDHGADIHFIDAADFTQTGILSSVCMQPNSTDIVKLLIEYGADINKRNKFGNTPLIMACDDYHPEKLETVKALVEAGADTNAQDDMGLTPIMHPVASELDFSDLLAYFLKYDLDVSLKNKQGETVRDMLVKKKKYNEVALIDAFVENKALQGCLNEIDANDAQHHFPL